MFLIYLSPILLLVSSSSCFSWDQDQMSVNEHITKPSEIVIEASPLSKDLEERNGSVSSDNDDFGEGSTSIEALKFADECSRTFVFGNEDHTLGNALRHVIANQVRQENSL